jgi:cytochrome b involved in lipid metabolism|tara:strand:- start:362 stop:772 length:411 start_codon:yes stop_codon:yes gene_type:complete
MKKILFLLTILILLVGCSAEAPVEPVVTEEIPVEVLPLAEETTEVPVEEPIIEHIEDESLISKEELATHDTEEDCWVSYDGNVYDITDYIPNHKGGKGSIINYCGSSDDFADAFTSKHGTSKVSVLTSQEFKGELE